jgi:hypothetical protein
VAATLFKAASLLEALVGDSAGILPIEVEGTELDGLFAKGENVGGVGGELMGGAEELKK